MWIWLELVVKYWFFECGFLSRILDERSYSDMFAEERYEKIELMIQQFGTIKVSELVEVFGVSIETIRRDLLYLEAHGVLKRVHGGAVTVSKSNGFMELDQRLSEYREEKAQMAKLAVHFIHENDSIAIDSGTTAIELAKVISELGMQLTVITHSIEVFDILNSNQDIKVILLGGQYYRKEKAFYGPLLIDTLDKLHVNISFVFPSAVSRQFGIEDYLLEMIPIQQGYIRIADRAFIVADHSKFENRAFACITRNLDKATFITDSNLSDDIYQDYIEQNIQLIRCDRLDSTD